MFDDFGASIRELRSTLMQSPDSEIQYARKQNSHLLERNAKLQLELTDLKVQFADIVQMVNQTNILHFKEPFESVKSLAEILQQTLNELSDTKATLLNRAKDYSVVVPQSNSPSSALMPFAISLFSHCLTILFRKCRTNNRRRTYACQLPHTIVNSRFLK